MITNRLLPAFLILIPLTLIQCNISEIDSISEPEVYQNQYLPQDFGLNFPVYRNVDNIAKLSRGESEVDLNKCYIDENLYSGEIRDHAARLCGIQFEQAKLELHALMLDVALPHVRALCKNKLSDCDLEGEEVMITISEPIMRRIEELYEFYRFVGLEDYYTYNGHELKNGAKIPYEISQYQESEYPEYDYSARVKTQVISTQGSDVEQREDSGSVTVHWDLSRHNILLEFKTIVNVFGYTINVRRVYKFSLIDEKLQYISQIMYWNGTSAFRYNNATTIQQCDTNCSCAKFYSLGGQFYGTDVSGDGLTADETTTSFMRLSKGIVSIDGGMVENFFPEKNEGIKEQIIFNNTAADLFRLQAVPGSTDWMFSASSPSVDWSALHGNSIYSETVDQDGVMVSTLQERLLAENGTDLERRSSYWLSTGDPASAPLLDGFGFTGQNLSIFIDWSREPSSSSLNQAIFLPDGSQLFQAAGPLNNLIPLEY